MGQKMIRVDELTHKELMSRGSKGESFNDIIKGLLKATEPKPVKVSPEIINELKEADVAYENGECISFTKKEFLEKF